MKKLLVMLLTILGAMVTFSGCRESKSKEEKAEDHIERAADEVEDGVKRAGEEIKGAVDDVKEELDGQTDDN